MRLTLADDFCNPTHPNLDRTPLMAQSSSPEPVPTDEQQAPNGWPVSLLRGFRQGERAALTQVYRLYAEDVAKTLRGGFSFRAGETTRRFVGYRSAFEFQDALQETFRRAFEPSSRQSYDGLRPFGAYLGTIARNVVLRSFRRSELLFPEVDEGSAAAPQTVPADPAVMHGPEGDVQREQVRRLVQAFLGELSESERTLMELRFQDGVSQRDAAEQLGMGRQRLRTLEDRLKARFVKHLNQVDDKAVVALLLPVLAPLLFAAVKEVLQ